MRFMDQESSFLQGLREEKDAADYGRAVSALLAPWTNPFSGRGGLLGRPVLGKWLIGVAMTCARRAGAAGAGASAAKRKRGFLGLFKGKEEPAADWGPKPGGSGDAKGKKEKGKKEKETKS